MSQALTQYAEVVREFCAALGIGTWQEVLASRHVELEGRLVGLVPPANDDEPLLSVFIELGATYPDRDGAVYERLLAANMEGGLAMRGHYAIHPQGRQAVYCMRFPLGGIQGADLALIVMSELQAHRLA